MDELADIDNPASLRQFIETFYGDWSLRDLAKRIRSVIATIVSFFIEMKQTNISSRFLKTHLLRAPPLRLEEVA